MKADMTKLIKTIKTEAYTKELTSFVFIGYFLLHALKGVLLVKGIKEQDIYKYLEVNKPTNLPEMKAESLLEAIDYELNYWKNTNKSEYNRILESWNILGLKVLRKEFKKNKSGFDKILLEFLQADVNILSLMDLFEGVKHTSKKFKDYFTPMDLSNFASRIVLHDRNFEKQDTIKVYDPTCGIGRLFYPAFVSLKEKYPNKTIQLLGMDLCEEYAVFTQSIFSLINLNNTHIFIGNSFFADPFSGTKMDIGLSNPPFGIKDYDIDTKMKLLKYEDKLFSRTQEHLSSALEKIYNKAPLISKKEYLSIKNDFRAA